MKKQWISLKIDNIITLICINFVTQPHLFCVFIYFVGNSVLKNGKNSN